MSTGSVRIAVYRDARRLVAFEGETKDSGINALIPVDTDAEWKPFLRLRGIMARLTGEMVPNLPCELAIIAGIDRSPRPVSRTQSIHMPRTTAHFSQ